MAGAYQDLVGDEGETNVPSSIANGRLGISSQAGLSRMPVFLQGMLDR